MKNYVLKKEGYFSDGDNLSGRDGSTSLDSIQINCNNSVATGAVYPKGDKGVQRDTKGDGGTYGVNCGAWTVRGLSEDGLRWRYLRLPCNSWRCSRCGPRKRKRLIGAISRTASELGLTRFLTLTVDHAVCPPEKSLDYIQDCWSELRIYLKRRFGESIKYILVREPQKSGHIHLHILIDRFIKQNWLLRDWYAVGGGKYGVWIKQIKDVHNVAVYVSKYMTKESLNVNLGYRKRRYSTSRGIVLFARRSSSGKWELKKIPIGILYNGFSFAEIIKTERDLDGKLQSFEVVGRPPPDCLDMETARVICYLANGDQDVRQEGARTFDPRGLTPYEFLEGKWIKSRADLILYLEIKSGVPPVRPLR